jgi:hypothetical protein
MADLGALFIDIFSRLNLPSAERAAKDAIGIWKKAGEDCSRSFSETTASIGTDFKMQFDEIVQTAEAAYREMEIGFRDLQQKEMEINNLRLQGFSATSDKMLAVQRDYEAKMLESQGRIAEAQRISDARIAAVAPDRSGGRHEEEPEPRGGTGRRTGPIIPLPRGANALGWASLLAGGAFVGESVRSAAEMQNTLNTLASLQHESQANIGLITQAVYRQAEETGVNRQDIAKLYNTAETATNQTTGKPYRGQDAIDIVTNALKLSRISGGRISNEEALQGLTTTMHDYRVGPEGSAGVAGMLDAFISEFKGNPDEAMRSLHSVEPSAMLSHIKPEEIFAALGLASQTGASGQQSAVNISNIIKSLAAPNSVTSKALSQLGLNPQDLGLELDKKGLGGTLQELQQALVKDMGPQGEIVLGAMTQNALMQQQQKVVFDQMSPVAQAFVNTEDVQKGVISPFKAKTLLQKAGAVPNMSETDMPLIQEWLKQQQTLEGPSQFLKQNKPLEESIRAAVGQMFNTKDASNIAMILGLGSPQGLDQFNQRTQGIKAGADPNAFEAAFKQAMEPDIQKWHTLGQAAGNLAARFGHDLLPIVGTVIDGLKDFVDFLGRNKAAQVALIGALGTAAAAFAGVKIVNGIEEMFGAFTKVKNAANGIGNLLSSRLPTQSVGAGAGSLDGAANQMNLAADKMNQAASKMDAAGNKQDAAGTKQDAAGTKEEIAAGEMQTAAGEEQLAAGTMGGIGNKLNSILAPAAIALMIRDAVHQAIPISDPKNQKHDWWHVGFGPLAEIWDPTEHHALGGIAGYWGGGKTGDPSQPLMGMPDMGGDSILGMLPGGIPVGLRGGEGILTPEATAALGGKEGIDALNDNPWAHPLHVASSFYGSFAKGVATYSPWGKYLTASSQTLDSLAQEFENSTGEHMGGHRGRLNRGGLPLEVEQMLESGMTPEQIEQALGVSIGKKGGLYLSDGSALPPKVRAMLGLPPAPARGHRGGGPAGYSQDEAAAAIISAAKARGLNKEQTLAALSVGLLETGLGANNMTNAAQDQNGTVVQGLFQQDSGYNRYFGGGPRTDPRGAADGFVDQFIARGGLDKDPYQGAVDVQVGQYGPGYVRSFRGQAEQYYNRDSWFASGHSRGGVVGYGSGGVAGFGLLPLDNNGFDFGGAGTGGGGLTRKGDVAPVPSSPPTTNRQLPHIPGDLPKPEPHQPAYKPNGYSDDHAIRPDQHLGTAAGHHEPPPMKVEHPDRNIKENPSQPLTAEGKGFGVGGGLLGAAEGAASMAANAFAPGSGQAAQQLFQLANLAIGYGGKLVGIGLEGIIGTLLPNDDPLADPSKNIFGKMALGLAGAHPSAKNWAGSSAQHLQPKQDLDQGAQAAKSVMPGINIHGDIHNHHNQEWDGLNKALNVGINMHPGLNAGV